MKSNLVTAAIFYKQKLFGEFFRHIVSFFNLLNANPAKWTNTLKQFLGKLPTNCLSVFDHFVGLVLKESIRSQTLGLQLH